MAGDTEALGFKEVADSIMGLVFFIGEFGVGPDLKIGWD